MERPLIQIDNEIREMNDDEYAQYEKDIANYLSFPRPQPQTETPV
jgi:hypothetical protein